MIREETAGDYDAVFHVERDAFGREDEARLVEQLREDGVVIASLVAVEEGEVVGHILFTELPVESEAGTVRAAALAPMAVRSDMQSRGIGSALVEAGIAVCRQRGVKAVVVLGHASYYPRFGFSAALASRLQAPFSGPVFMAMELEPGSLAAGGKPRYAEAFGVPDC